MNAATSIVTWAHRCGLVRTLNYSSNNMNRRRSAYIETRGPRWLGESLWRFVLRHADYGQPDWLTVRVEKVQQPSRLRFRWLIKFDAI